MTETSLCAESNLMQIINMASAGNVVGMRRLLGRYRQLHLAVRAHLEDRLKHETARAGRLQVGLQGRGGDRGELKHETARTGRLQVGWGCRKGRV